jgi:hypothetical protein
MDPERVRGQKLLAEVGDVFLRQRYLLSDLPLVNVYLARERARRGDRDAAIPLMRAAVDHLVREGQLLGWGVSTTGVLVETLLDRGANGDVTDAEAAIERLAAAPADDRLVIREMCLLRLRALLARAQSDETAYRDYRDRYRAMATELGFEGHIAMAAAMTSRRACRADPRSRSRRDTRVSILRVGLTANADGSSRLLPRRRREGLGRRPET